MLSDSGTKSRLVETVTSGFAPGMKVHIYKSDDAGFYCLLDMNRVDYDTREVVPIKYYGYNTILLLQRLLEKTIDRLSFHYFATEEERKTYVNTARMEKQRNDE